MNKKEVILNKNALEYSIENNVDKDVDLERFENQAIPSLRNCLFKFVMSDN